MSGEVRQYGQQQSQRRPMRVRAGVITSTELADDAVTTAKIADDAVTTAKIPDGAVTEVKLSAAVQTKLNASEVESVLTGVDYQLADASGVSLDRITAVTNTASSSITLTTTGGLINTVSSFVLLPEESLSVVSDGTNYRVI